MTPTQRRLARHALGLPNRAMCSYRNRFCLEAVDYGSDRMLWDQMKDNGWADIFPHRMTPSLTTYYLTRKGAGLALDPGERLDEEDF